MNPSLIALWRQCWEHSIILLAGEEYKGHSATFTSTLTGIDNTLENLTELIGYQLESVTSESSVVFFKSIADIFEPYAATRYYFPDRTFTRIYKHEIETIAAADVDGDKVHAGANWFEVVYELAYMLDNEFQYYEDRADDAVKLFLENGALHQACVLMASHIRLNCELKPMTQVEF